MKVVLRTDVEQLGRKGDVLDVADGYARNFLVPRGLAMKATDGVAQQAVAMRRNREAREAREREQAEVLAAQLAAARIEIRARAGEAGKLFGSVTAMEIAVAVQERTGIEIDRRRVDLEEPLKELGPHEIIVRLHPGVDATLTIEVVAE